MVAVCVWFLCCLLKNSGYYIWDWTTELALTSALWSFCFHLTFQGNPISANGSNGIIHVTISFQRRVDMNHLKVHWYTAESIAWMNSETSDSCFYFKGLNMIQCRSDLKTSLTWFNSSGPIPSPGIRVTVCLPPYFAGGGCNMTFYTQKIMFISEFKTSLQSNFLTFFIFIFISKHAVERLYSVKILELFCISN